jgi:MFS family permease
MLVQESRRRDLSGRGYSVRRYRVVGLCSLAAFVCYIDRVNISVAALAMQERLGWSTITKGWVLSSFFAGYLAFQMPGGWLANRLGNGCWVPPCCGGRSVPC